MVGGGGKYDKDLSRSQTSLKSFVTEVVEVLIGGNICHKEYE